MKGQYNSSEVEIDFNDKGSIRVIGAQGERNEK
jgi:hypothetical protein